MSKCDACPLPDSPCVGECPRGQQFCDHARTGEENRLRHIVLRSLHPCPYTPSAEAAPTPPRAPYTPSRHAQEQARVNACPHRTVAYGIGCCSGSRATCNLGKSDGGGEVSTAFCLSCLDGAPP